MLSDRVVRQYIDYITSIMWGLAHLFVFFACFYGIVYGERNPSVVIVGGGPSGIAAATKLLKNSITNIKILEAENRQGGRVNSVKFGDGYVDLGAQFCHGEKDNIVYSLTKDLGVLKHASGDVKILYSNGVDIDQQIQDKIFHFAHSLDASESDDENKRVCQNLSSVGDCFDKRYNILLQSAHNVEEERLLKDLKLWTIGYLLQYDSSFDLGDLLSTSDYKKCDGDLFLNWNGHGYKTVLEVMMQKFPNRDNQLPIDDKILLNKEVINVKYKSGDQIAVVCKDGSSYSADHVLFTPSVGVLKHDHETLFDPQLPKEKVDAIKNIGYGAIMKIILHFPQPTTSISNILGIVWREEDLKKLKELNIDWLQSLSGTVRAENNNNVLIGWYAGERVPAIEKLTDEEILEGQNYLVEKILGPKYNLTLPDQFIRSSWYSNPHFRGTYSYESVKGHSSGGKRFPDKLASPLLDDNGVPRVLFAGEATHPYYFSTVHGAIETGYREAERLIDYYKIKQ
ncbi:spermine oxidase-like [Cylas formicarius]|uniref:spermine oxidase-like n=1 Tax=Cylas formicarius TaxID=197179 RepID=UPI002958A767|nr:spermine oxidase-like [Cylas formicarius]